LAVSRKVGNAVVRNRLKRRIREIVRRQLSGDEGVDLLIIARPGAASREFSELSREVGNLLRSARLGPRR
jgi:ribonuclease P protein component